MHQSLWDNFKTIGRRLPYLIKYKAGTDAAGKLAGIALDIYGDVGTFSLLSAIDSALGPCLTLLKTWKGFTKY